MVRISKKLCDANDVTQSHVNSLAAAGMAKVESRAIAADDMTVVNFWARVYLPDCEKEWKDSGMRASTVRGFKQVWKQRLKQHCSTTITLQQ